jgi:uncharacterized protein YfcZ (UPF0381/DUF406 family)
MTKLEELKAEAETARVACNTAYAAYEAHAEAYAAAYDAARGVYSDPASAAAEEAAAEDAAEAGAAYDAACDAHVTAAEVYQAELKKTQKENDNDTDLHAVRTGE